MRNSSIFIICMIFFSTGSSQTVVKSNLLNIIFIPSLHLEQGLNLKSSIQLNVHRGKFFPGDFFTAEFNWFTCSFDYRSYFHLNKNIALSGLYISPGLNYSIFFDESPYNTNIPANTSRSNIGPSLKLGFQIISPRSRWSFDFGIGAAVHLIFLEKRPDNKIIYSPRAALALGYRLFGYK